VRSHFNWILRANAKLCEEVMYGTFFGRVFTKLMGYFDDEISDFQLGCGRFSPTDI
jgi:hypothetical protein